MKQTNKKPRNNKIATTTKYNPNNSNIEYQNKTTCKKIKNQTIRKQQKNNKTNTNKTTTNIKKQTNYK